MLIVIEGRYVIDLAFENAIKVCVATHPSMLQIPADLEVSNSLVSA
jgi:hypothetical protein